MALQISHSTLGLEWENIGSAKPKSGRNLNGLTEWIDLLGQRRKIWMENPELAKALQSSVTFTLEKWNTFGITDMMPNNVLRTDDFIKSGASYFQPAGPRSNTKTISIPSTYTLVRYDIP